MTNWKDPPVAVEDENGKVVLNLTASILLIKSLIEDAPEHERPRMREYLKLVQSYLTNVNLVKETK